MAFESEYNKTILPETYVELDINVTDPQASADITPSVNNKKYYANIAQVVNSVDEDFNRYASLEPNMWILDGKSSFIGDGDYMGAYVSRYSSGEVRFDLNFSHIHTKLLSGITIVWSKANNEYPKAFTVIAKNGSSTVAQKTINNNDSVVSVIWIDIKNYNKIRVVVNNDDWCLPDRLIRIEKIVLGIRKTYTKKDIIKFKQSISSELLIKKLPKNNIEFEIDNVDGEYSPDNIHGLSKYLIERQEVKVKYGMKIDGSIDWINAGAFYLSDWKAKAGAITASFKAESILSLLDKKYIGGTYNSSGKSFYELATDVLESANLPLESDGSKKWEIDDSLKSYRTKAPLPVKSIRECLQLIVSATPTTLMVSRDGKIVIKGIGDRTNRVLKRMNLYSEPTTSLSKPIKTFVVKQYSYKKESAYKELYKGTFKNSGTKTVVINHSEMATNINISVSGGSLLSSKRYARASELTIRGNGNITVTVTGKPLKISTVDRVIDMGEKGEIITLNNPLITEEKVINDTLHISRDILSYRKRVNADLRINPSIDILDKITYDNAFGDEVDVIVEDIQIDYNGAIKGKMKGLVI